MYIIERHQEENSPTIISTKTNQHNTRLTNLAFSFELHFSLHRLYSIALDYGGFVAVREHYEKLITEKRSREMGEISTLVFHTIQLYQSNA